MSAGLAEPHSTPRLGCLISWTGTDPISWAVDAFKRGDGVPHWVPSDCRPQRLRGRLLQSNIARVIRAQRALAVRFAVKDDGLFARLVRGGLKCVNPPHNTRLNRVEVLANDPDVSYPCGQFPSEETPQAVGAQGPLRPGQVSFQCPVEGPNPVVIENLPESPCCTVRSSSGAADWQGSTKSGSFWSVRYNRSMSS